MFGRYALPSDDLATAATVTASAADPGYVAANLVRNPPSRPAKLTTNTGYWDLVFAAPVEIGAMAMLYHNIDSGLDVTLEPDGGTPINIDVPSWHPDGTPISPFQEFDAQTSDTWRLSINAANTLTIDVGRLMLFAALRDLGNDVRWGVEEDEEYGLIEQATELGVELIAPIGGKRRRFSGEFALDNTHAATLTALFQSAQSRYLPWLLIPDVAVNDAWIVRLEENKFTRVRETYDHNIFPFRVRELSRGTPWP